MDIEAVKRQIAELHQGRKWILTPDVAAAAGPMVEQLKEWGVDGIMLIAGIEGVGEVPDVDSIHYTGTSGDTIMQGIRAFVQSIDEPSSRLQAAIDRFDPRGEAMVLGIGFSRQDNIGGRPVYGPIQGSWRDLEDKMVVDELWNAAGVPHAPARVVPVASAPSAASQVEGELGTVWVADNKEGWHGGGEYARWVRGPEHVQPAVDWFAEHADEVRVMPFLDGLPCSIHGFVTGNGVAVFNPVELLIYRRTDRPTFFYAQGGNFWTPPDTIRIEMRAAAKVIGALLHDRHGYLGAFGIDGICTAEGFRPTELNPRISLGHGVHSRAADLPLGSMQRMILAGDMDIDARDLEETILDAATTRRGGAMFELENEAPEHKTDFVIVDGRASPVNDDDPNDGTMLTGPAAFRSLLIIQFDSDRTPVGPSLAPRALAVLDLARDLWNVSVPDLQPAPDLHKHRTQGSTPE
jgi:hypothetical protein